MRTPTHKKAVRKKKQTRDREKVLAKHYKKGFYLKTIKNSYKEAAARQSNRETGKGTCINTANNQMKQSSTSLVIREKQIKTILKTD